MQESKHKSGHGSNLRELKSATVGLYGGVRPSHVAPPFLPLTLILLIIAMHLHADNIETAPGQLLDNQARTALANASGEERPPLPHNTIALQPPVFLPDGSQYKSWERPQNWSRQYYVNASHRDASDANPGTENKPFATISRAAEVLQPGECVIVEAGVYRETIRPPRGGTDPDQMIGYLARPGAEVVISGAEVLIGPWRAVTKENLSITAKNTIHAIVVPDTLCGTDSPLASLNLSPYAIDRFLRINRFQNADLRRILLSSPAMLFQDGRRLQQALALTSQGNFQSSPCLETAGPGHFYVDADGRTIYVWPYHNTDPNKAQWKLTARRQLLVPSQPGLGFIMIKGFRFEYAGNPLPMPHYGAVSSNAGNHWIIENNHIREANGIGLDLGRQHWIDDPPPLLGNHIVRSNLIEQCGAAGISATGTNRLRFQLLVEDNTFRDCAYLPAHAMHENSAFKAHFLYGSVIRNNRFLGTRHGSAIWLDNRTGNNRVTGNLIANIHSTLGAVFVELGDLPNLIDANILVDINGDGIYSHDAGGVLVAHNLLANVSGSPIHIKGTISPRAEGLRIGFNQVRNNLLVNSPGQLQITGTGNTVANNPRFNGSVRLHAEPLRLHWQIDAPIPLAPQLEGVDRDFWGKSVGPLLTGPFATEPTDVLDVSNDKTP